MKKPTEAGEPVGHSLEIHKMNEPNISHSTAHVQTIFRQLKDLPREERLAAFDDSLMERQVIESLEYPITETFDEYQIRVWQELQL